MASAQVIWFEWWRIVPQNAVRRSTASFCIPISGRIRKFLIFSWKSLNESKMAMDMKRSGSWKRMPIKSLEQTGWQDSSQTSNIHWSFSDPITTMVAAESANFYVPCGTKKRITTTGARLRKGFLDRCQKDSRATGKTSFRVYCLMYVYLKIYRSDLHTEDKLSQFYPRQQEWKALFDLWIKILHKTKVFKSTENLIKTGKATHSWVQSKGS